MTWSVLNNLTMRGGVSPGRLREARWSSSRWARVLARRVVALPPADAEIVLVGGGTVFSDLGRRVFGKARHRDPVRSSHAFNAYPYGHKWVVLAVLVRCPSTARPWALPVPVALYRNAADDRRAKRRHRTPAQQQAIRLPRLMLHWFPGRRFVFVGDSAYGTHDLARFADRNRGWLTLVRKLHFEANNLDPPPYRGLGRRVKGARRPKLRKAVAEAGRRRLLEIAWYGGGTRRDETTTDAGRCCKKGEGLVPVRWVFVHDREGPHRDEYFYATDLRPASADGRDLTPAAGTSRQRSRKRVSSSISRRREDGASRRSCGPRRACSGYIQVLAMLHAMMPPKGRVGGVAWPVKTVATFSDALAAVRRRIWAEGVIARAPDGPSIQGLPPHPRCPLRRTRPFRVEGPKTAKVELSFGSANFSARAMITPIRIYA